MYNSQATPIRLWQLPNTLAGDAAVTVLVQNGITWLIERVLVARDLARGGVAPVGFLPPPTGRAARWFLLLNDRDEENENDKEKHWAGRLAALAARAAIVAVATFCLLWPPAVGILTAVGGTRTGGDWMFSNTWTPQIFKLVFGGVLALLTTPLFALFWLVRAGWALRDDDDNNDASPPDASEKQ